MGQDACMWDGNELEMIYSRQDALMYRDKKKTQANNHQRGNPPNHSNKDDTFLICNHTLKIETKSIKTNSLKT